MTLSHSMTKVMFYFDGDHFMAFSPATSLYSNRWLYKTLIKELLAERGYTVSDITDYNIAF